MRVLAGLLSALLFVSFTATAKPKDPPKADQEKLAKAAKLYEEGDTLYKVKEYEKALANFKEAYLLTSEPLLLYNIGQCHRQLNQLDEARKSFESFLRDAPQDSDLRPNAESLLAEVNKEIARLASKSTIQISSKQDPTEVFLDNLPAGTSPLTLSELEPGKHVITIKKEGYQDTQVSVTLEPGQTLPLEIPELALITQEEGFPKAVLYGYIGSGVFAAAGAGAGVIALSAAITAENVADGESRSDMDKAKLFALAADVSFGVAAIGAGVSYFIYRKKTQTSTTEKNARLLLSPSSVGVQVQY